MEQWEIEKQFQPMGRSPLKIKEGYEPFAVTKADESGVWIWLKKSKKEKGE